MNKELLEFLESLAGDKVVSLDRVREYARLTQEDMDLLEAKTPDSKLSLAGIKKRIAQIRASKEGTKLGKTRHVGKLMKLARDKKEKAVVSKAPTKDVEKKKGPGRPRTTKPHTAMQKAHAAGAKRHNPFKYNRSLGPAKAWQIGPYPHRSRRVNATDKWDCEKKSPYVQSCRNRDSGRIKIIRIKKSYKTGKKGYNTHYKKMVSAERRSRKRRSE